MPPVQLYYEGSPEEDQDLLELREAHYDRLRALELQAARFGDAVPASIAAGIADAQSQIKAIDEVRQSIIRPETAEKLGQTGQFTVLAGRINLVSQQIRLMQISADEWREGQRTLWRTVKMIFIAIGIVLAFLASAILGLAFALWSLR